MRAGAQEAAQAGPNTAELSHAELRGYVIAHLDEAIQNRWIRAYYQPVVRTVSGKLCGMEALARWEDPEHGLLQPGDFIGALEDARLIHKLDSCIVRQVCSQFRESLDAGEPIVPVSLNLSRLDFDLCDIHDVIEQAIHRYKLPRDLLNIEITESVFGSDPAFMATAINTFHETGYQVWMDDFGSAYSSLNVLKDFDFDELKIDMGFLSRFGEKSRTIIASVVDMAKRLGMQTLAEGVETAEHSEFLRHIGCEKQQGFFYGKPQPYSPEYIGEIEERLGIERRYETQYYRTIGSVNTLSLSERDFMPDNTTKDYVTSMPLAFVEYNGSDFSILDCNDPFVESIEALGISGVDALECLINDTTRTPARSTRRLMEALERDRYARHDFIMGDRTCVMRAKFVAATKGRTSALIAIESAARMKEKDRRERMNVTLETIYTVYEHVDIMHLDEGWSEPVYSKSIFKNVYDVPDLADAVRQFADNELFPADRERYLAFMDVTTLLQRIAENGQGYIVGFFRTRGRGGNYDWKMFAAIRLAEQIGNKVLVCVRDTNWENDALFQAIYDSDDETGSAASEIGKVPDLSITDASLWRSLASNQFGLFWKDTDRRFVGCNQAFLDYFEFSSADAIVGKTDEDMGWHVDPVPYINEETKVLKKGETTENVPGQVIAKGELRDIVATKRPIYRNGRIIGLLGYFIDTARLRVESGPFDIDPYADAVTGLLNYGGLDVATARYIEAYQKSGSDFTVLAFDIENFTSYNDQYGYDFGDKVLRHVADTLRALVGADCVAGRVNANRFVIMRQNASLRRMQTIGNLIKEALGDVSEIDGNPCTIYIDFAIVKYSEVEDIEELKHITRARLRGLDEFLT